MLLFLHNPFFVTGRHRRPEHGLPVYGDSGEVGELREAAALC